MLRLAQISWKSKQMRQWILAWLDKKVIGSCFQPRDIQLSVSIYRLVIGWDIGHIT